ncbi:SDR family NAD(P)-dependent oxidoreductase [Calothrix rhizosoleniae]|uniref:SDR family NAD(P)-dependent oxidoreductase n=1 Tax=Calothrix rhizosoleniae TaxID=888997 RepID=UPI00135665E2|nr:SDR family oxidoreductase [Calothrix rhizosoleniae]
MSYSLPLAKQVILITGAAGGIGSATALHLAKQYPGICLILTDFRQEQLEQCATLCKQAGAQVLTIPADLTNSVELANIPKAAVKHFGAVHVLINNAGYSQSSPVESMSTATVEKHFQVNILAPISLIQTLIPVMRRQGFGRIINVSSLAGCVAFPFEGIYGASKFALEGLSDALRMELSPFNIQVIVIELGAVLTQAFKNNTKALIKCILEPQNTPYSKAFQRLSQLFIEVEQQAWTPEKVAQTIHKTLITTHPKPRYVAASAAVKLSFFIMNKMCPTSILDRFRKRLYGMNLISQDLPKYGQLNPENLS